MKTRLYGITLALLVLATIKVSSFGQSSAIVQHDSLRHINGIYLTEADLRAGQLSNVAGSDLLNTIHVNLDSRLTVIRRGNEEKIGFGKISGYYLDGAKYRAFGKTKATATHGYYKVLDESGLTIYSRNVSLPKSGRHTWYYYSLDLQSPIQHLTLKNLEKDFAGKPAFIEAVRGAEKDNQWVELVDGKTRINAFYKMHVQP
jgi:hypothetical protein